MNILVLESFYSGSHQTWADGLKQHSSHSITIWTLPGRHWKWRMHGAAISFAERLKIEKPQVDVILATDLLDIATLKGVAGIKVPIILYFHENQLAYPWSSTDTDPAKNWDRRYVWINFTSAMAADHIWFNSEYNCQSFLGGLPKFLHAFPDRNSFGLQELWDKSKVLPLGINLADCLKTHNENKNDAPVFLWNHRWEYDKNPGLFFETMGQLKEKEISFKLIVLGTKSGKYPKEFDVAKKRLTSEIIHWGSVESKSEYINLLAKADFLPVSNMQDFFGISVIEAIAAGVIPLLPEGLAYEEHIPKIDFPELFYHQKNQFLPMILALLNRKKAYDLRNYVAKYDWSACISKYDKLLDNSTN